MKKKNKVGGGLGGMVAAMMPGAEIDDKGRVLVNIATSRETLIFNIGGVNFETYRYVRELCHGLLYSTRTRRSFFGETGKQLCRV